MNRRMGLAVAVLLVGGAGLVVACDGTTAPPGRASVVPSLPSPLAPSPSWSLATTETEIQTPAKTPEPPTETPDSAAASAPKRVSRYYRSCANARAEGAAPLHEGEPGYRAGLDRDSDGVACET